MDLKAVVGALLDGGMTQMEIADACGCAQSTISAIYRGENKNPSFSLGQSLVSLMAIRQAKAPKRAKAVA